MAVEALTRDQLEKLESMWKSPGLIGTLVAVAAAFGSWTLLLPTIPLAVIESGQSEALAGATTGIFMLATVLTQIFTPKALRTWGYTPVMVGSAFILGVPSFLYAFSVAPIPVLAISALRGGGFGALTVAESALIAELVPLRFLGKASGTLGLVVGLVQMLLLPLGLTLAKNVGFVSVYIIASVVALGAVVACLRLPRISPAPVDSTAPDSTSPRLVPKVATWKLITVPAIAMNTLAMGFGAISSFLPAAVRSIDPANGVVIAGFVLSVVGGTQMVSRYWAGAFADRKGEAGLLIIPSIALGIAGLATTAAAVGLGWPSWSLLFTAALFGLGFGAAQNEVLLMMFARLPRSRVSDASAMWNISYDSGTGLGSVLLGFVAGSFAYHGAFAAAAGIVSVGLAITTADKIVGSHRIAEEHNTRAIMRRVPMARATYHATRRVARAGLRPIRATGQIAGNATKATSRIAASTAKATGQIAGKTAKVIKPTVRHYSGKEDKRRG